MVAAVPDRRRSVLAASDLQLLIDALSRRGYTVVGPTVKEGAIVLDRITCSQDLPAGWTDHHEDGRYRLERRPDSALFGYNLGASSWKAWLNPPTERLWRAVRDGDGIRIQCESPSSPTLALLGIRACEVHAVRKLDSVLRSERSADPVYSGRRGGALLIAVTCGQAGANCFCSSLGTGPLPEGGYDICLTEVLNRKLHSFVVEAGTDLGAEIVAGLPCAEADEQQRSLPETIAARTASKMGRSVDTQGLRDLLYAAYEHPHWDDVAARCLTCGNCTMVCPTCFCTTVEDSTDLVSGQAERTRRWDSCFTMDFTFINGGSVRYSGAARYRQWLVHKFATWQGQFGETGCVGCGRCITWCPAGIDVTKEIRALRKRAHSGAGASAASLPSSATSS